MDSDSDSSGPLPAPDFDAQREELKLLRVHKQNILEESIDPDEDPIEAFLKLYESKIKGCKPINKTAS